jgi:hypothetical protein
MGHQFTKHYTREEARALLPLINAWLDQLNHLRADLEKQEKRLKGLMTAGADLGGNLVNKWVKLLAELQGVLVEFYRREIQVKDLERGLIDFPAIVAGKEVFLCWEKGEPDIEFWHDLNTGYAGREKL